MIRVFFKKKSCLFVDVAHEHLAVAIAVLSCLFLMTMTRDNSLCAVMQRSSQNMLALSNALFQSFSSMEVNLFSLPMEITRQRLTVVRQIGEHDEI